MDSNYSTIAELHRQAEVDAAQLQARDAAEWFRAAMDEADAQGHLAARRERQVCYLRNTIKMQAHIVCHQRDQLATKDQLIASLRHQLAQMTEARDTAVAVGQAALSDCRDLADAATHAGIVSGALRALLLELPKSYRGETPDGEIHCYEVPANVSQRIWGLAGVLRKESEAK